MRTWIVLGALLTTLVGGCFAEEEPQSPATPQPVPSSEVNVSGGVVEMDVPAPVFLLGFDDATAAALQERLAPMTLSDSGALRPRAVFTVHTPDAAWQDAFDAFLANTTHPGHASETGFTGPILDGNAIEAYLAQHLDAIHAVPDGITSLVVLDAGLRGHAYHYAGNVGWREPVRAFGEFEPLLVWDPYAAADPWVGTASPLHAPVTSAGADHIAAWIQRATAIRTLQMPIWPPTTLTCHAITILFAVRGTSVTPTVLGLQSWDEAFNLPRIQATFENLTGDPVHVDLVVKQLPVDDPPLELAARENDARVLSSTYVDLNFDDYHVAHEGCEPYLSLVVFGDLADQRTSSNGNARVMASGNRISTGLVAENVRVMTEYVGYNQQWDESTTFERVGPGADPLAWFDWLVVHETGHLFSLPHPNYSTGNPSYSDAGFASTWNVMGYQMRRIVTDTGLVDANNFQRNQAAYALVAASPADDRFDLAKQAMGEYRWKDATYILAGQP